MGNCALNNFHFELYPNTHHAFFNDTREAYDEGAAADAWERTLEWFRQHLQ
ncbi:MAG: dienelactone hydrolase family protein [Chloroflexota bacterium]